MLSIHFHDFFDAKGIVEGLLEAIFASLVACFRVPELYNIGWFGRATDLQVARHRLGWNIHPLSLQNYDIEVPAHRL